MVRMKVVCLSVLLAICFFPVLVEDCVYGQTTALSSVEETLHTPCNRRN